MIDRICYASGMTHSMDLRLRVVAFVSKGGSKVEAAQRFSVSRATVYGWLGRTDLSPKVHGPRQRKLDKASLLRHVRNHPEALLRERAAYFGVHINAIWEALQKLNIRFKKNAALPGTKRGKKNSVSAKAARHRS